MQELKNELRLKNFPGLQRRQDVRRQDLLQPGLERDRARADIRLGQRLLHSDAGVEREGGSNGHRR